MSKQFDIAVLVGSLRKHSLNRLLAQEVAVLSPASLALQLIEIGDVPLYNDDWDLDPPSAWVSLRSRIARADGVLFVSPEYNRSIPAALKNAIDVLSRPYGKNALDAKPAAIITTSPGALGGFGANHHLRQVLMCLNVRTLPTPEAYIGNAANLFDERGKLVEPNVSEFLTNFMLSFEEWVQALGPRR
jgi:chromate reductase